jgi:hypothetical protein
MHCAATIDRTRHRRPELPDGRFTLQTFHAFTDIVSRCDARFG